MCVGGGVYQCIGPHPHSKPKRANAPARTRGKESLIRLSLHRQGRGGAVADVTHTRARLFHTYTHAGNGSRAVAQGNCIGKLHGTSYPT